MSIKKADPVESYEIYRALESVIVVVKEQDKDKKNGICRYVDGESDDTVAKRVGGKVTAAMVEYRRRIKYGTLEIAAPLLAASGDYAELRLLIAALQRSHDEMDRRMTAYETQRAVAQSLAS